MASLNQQSDDARINALENKLDLLINHLSGGQTQAAPAPAAPVQTGPVGTQPVSTMGGTPVVPTTMPATPQGVAVISEAAVPRQQEIPAPLLEILFKKGRGNKLQRIDPIGGNFRASTGFIANRSSNGFEAGEYIPPLMGKEFLEKLPVNAIDLVWKNPAKVAQTGGNMRFSASGQWIMDQLKEDKSRYSNGISAPAFLQGRTEHADFRLAEDYFRQATDAEEVREYVNRAKAVVAAAQKSGW